MTDSTEGSRGKERSHLQHIQSYHSGSSTLLELGFVCGCSEIQIITIEWRSRSERLRRASPEWSNSAARRQTSSRGQSKRVSAGQNSRPNRTRPRSQSRTGTGRDPDFELSRVSMMSADPRRNTMLSYGGEYRKRQRWKVRSPRRIHGWERLLSPDLLYSTSLSCSGNVNRTRQPPRCYSSCN